MGLMDHDFQYCRTRDEFQQTYGELMSNLIGKKLIRLYGVWDQIDSEWFVDPPMLLEFEHGELAVNTLSDQKIAVLWNEISHTQKPVWFDTPPKEFEWKEDLTWKEYYDLGGRELGRIEIIACDTAVVGMVFTTDGNEVGIVDNGDTTIGLIDESLWQYYREQLFDYYRIQNVMDYKPQGKHIEFDHFFRIFNRAIQIGIYPEEDFFWEGERYSLRADLKSIELVKKQEWESRFIEVEPEIQEYCLPCFSEKMLITCDTFAELLDKEVLKKRSLKDVWEELEFIPIDDYFDHRFSFNDWVYIKSIKKFGIVRQLPEVYPDGLFYGVAIEGTDWLEGPFYKAHEDDLEYDERPETIEELRESYQDYLYRISH